MGVTSDLPRRCTPFGILSTLPPFPGKLRIVNWVAALSSRCHGPNQQVSAWPGVRFSVDLQDRIQRQMWGGCFEPHVTHCLKAFLRPGNTFLDIGANIGYHSLYAAKCVQSHGNVYAFDPDPGLFKHLRSNFQDFPQARAFPFAVWNCSGSMTFERSSTFGESGWGKLACVSDLRQGERLEVRAVSLDEWNLEVKLASLHLIKIDAEGSELAILVGARGVLARFRPALIVEINETVLRQGGASAEAIAAKLQKCGYRIYDLLFKRLQQRELFREFNFAECLCLPEEAAERCLAALKENGFKV